MMQVMEEKLYRLGSVRKEPNDKQQDDTTIAEGDAPKTISLSQLPCSLGYFLLTDVIGQGGMGTVYNAVDLRSGSCSRQDHPSRRPVERLSLHRGVQLAVDVESSQRRQALRYIQRRRLALLFDGGCRGQTDSPVVRRRDQQHALDQLRHVLSQAALAVAFLHDHEVLHRDIKNSNLMITGRGRAVLLDLGLASRVSDERAQSRPLDGQQLVGTLHYLSPEALHGHERRMPATGIASAS